MKWLAALMALCGMGCAPGIVSSTRCAKPASLVTLPSAEGLQYTESTGVGGYIIATHASDYGHWDDPSTYTKSYCTAVIEKNLLEPSGYVMWTAAHCIDYANIVKVELVRYDTSQLVNGFGSWRLGNALQHTADAVTSMRGLGNGVEPVVMEALFTVFANPKERRGTEWCKRFTALQRDAAYQQLCTSLEDMELIQFSTPALENQTQSFKELAAAVNALPQSANETLRTRLRNWQAAYVNLYNLRMQVHIARYMNRVNACPGDGSDAVFCAARDNAILMAQMIFPRVVSFDPQKKLVDAIAEYEIAKQELPNLWQTSVLPEAGNGLLERIRIHSGFRFVTDLVADAPDFNPTQMPVDAAFLGLPVLAGVNENAAAPSIVFGEQGFILNKPLAQAMKLRHGDSGTSVSFHPEADIAFPLGVLSTVDGEPTSGGLSMRPVSTTPASEEEENPSESVPVAGKIPASQTTSCQN